MYSGTSPCDRPVRRRRRRPLPPGAPPAARPGRQRDRGDGRREHRRRPLAPRPEGLPRPRHHHVHPRRRHRPRARVGAPRRVLARQGGARGVRRRADLVRAGRPGPGDPPRPHPDARRRLPALGGDRGALRPVAARGAAAPDDRRPRRDPRRRRRRARAVGTAGGPLPGVLDPAAARRCRRVRSSRSGSTRPRRPRACSRRSRRRTSCSLPPSNPVVSVGTVLGVPGVREALRATSAPVVGLSPIIAGKHVRGMAEQLLTAVGVEVSAAGVAEHYGARSAGGVLDGWLVDTADAAAVPRLEAAGVRGGRRTAADDRPRRDGRDGGRGAAAWS